MILLFSIFAVLMLMNLLGAISLFVVVTFNRQITQQSYSVTMYTFSSLNNLGTEKCTMLHFQWWQKSKPL